MPPRRSGRLSGGSTHHHESADHLAVREAAKLLSDSEVENELVSPRAKRHFAIIQARAESELKEAEAEAEAEAGFRPASEKSDSEEESENDSEDGSDSSDDAGSSSEADSDSSDSDSDDEELERYLAAARIAAAGDSTATATKSTSTGALGEDDDGELRFDADAPKEAAIPDLAVGALPAQVIAYAEDGTATAGASLGRSGKSTDGPSELDRGAYERALSKREKLAQPKKASASELWATLPSARADDLAQMKRDYQALALSHTLDPKRFMKGGNRAGKVPEKFQIGTMIDAPRRLQDTTVRKERKYRAGEIVSSIVADDNLGSYAKRKFEDLQGKRMHNGRGKGWQKRTKW